MPDTRNLTTDEVLHVHDVLVRNFSATSDPIAPPGVRDRGLLESAVARQDVCFDGIYKYTNPHECAATLTYGLCNNHPFHNGNKRTALVCMLAHLDKNGLALVDTKQKDLFDMILALACKSLSPTGRTPPSRRRKRKKRDGATQRPRSGADEQVQALTQWIQLRAKKPRRGEKQITYRELRRILRGFGFELRPSKRGNHQDVYRVRTKTTGLCKTTQRIHEQRIGTIGYRDEGTFVAVGDLKKIRRLCNLQETDGVDSAAFYDDDAVIEGFVNRYRTILRRLARR